METGHAPCRPCFQTDKFVLAIIVEGYEMIISTKLFYWKRFSKVFTIVIVISQDPGDNFFFISFSYFVMGHPRNIPVKFGTKNWPLAIGESFQANCW